METSNACCVFPRRVYRAKATMFFKYMNDLHQRNSRGLFKTSEREQVHVHYFNTVIDYVLILCHVYKMLQERILMYCIVW